MIQNLLKSNFSGGEFGPGLFSAFEVPRYSTATREMYNMFCRPHGTCTNRPGLELVAEVYATSGDVRLFEFQFNVSQSYVLEFGDKYIRVLTNSGVVTDADENEVIIESVYAESDIKNIRTEQSNDNLYLLHKDYPPYKLCRYSHSDWRLEEIVYGASIEPPANLRISKRGSVPIAVTKIGITVIDEDGEESVISKLVEATIDATISWDEVEGATNYQIYKLNSEGVIGWIAETALTSFRETDHEAGGYTPDTASTPTGQSSLLPPDKINVSIPDTTAGNTGDDEEACWDMLVIAVDEDGKYSERSEFRTVFMSDTLAWDPVAGADYYRVYKAENGAFGWVANTEGTTYKDPDQDAGTVPDMTSTAPIMKLPFAEDDNKPGKATNFKARLIYGDTNSAPNTLFGSKTGDFENMSVSNPLGDDDAFTWKVLTSKMNNICWLKAYGNDLIIATQGGILKHACGGEALTPDSPNIIPEKTKGGCADMPPLDVGDSILYLQHGNPRVRDFVYSLEIDGYRGDDLSLFAYHLVDGYEIVDWCFQRDPDSIPWLIRNDGILLGLTYAKEHQVYGWHKHETDGKFKSCACISDGDYDHEVYFVIEREISGVTKRYIEKFRRRIDNDPVEAFFADSTLTYRGDPITTVTGLEHLEGKEVVVLAGGHVIKNKVVTSGQITLDKAERVIHVGLPFVSRVVSMNLIAQINKGVSIGVNQGIREVAILYENSWRCYVGTANNELEVLEFDDAPAINKEVTINTGNKKKKGVSWSGGYNAYVIVENRDPTPLTVAGLIVTAEFGDS